MANKKFTDLVALSSADSNDVLAIVDVSANSTKKITVDGLIASGSISTVKIADSAVTGDKIAYTKTTDANGWTVITYANGKKRYLKTITGNSMDSLATGAEGFAINTTQGVLPVGMANWTGKSVKLLTSTNQFSQRLVFGWDLAATTAIQVPYRCNNATVAGTGNATCYAVIEDY